MKCPHCEAALVMSDRQGIEIDYCPRCRGVWLDRGELDKIIARSAAIEAGRYGRDDDEDDDDRRTRYPPPQTGHPASQPGSYGHGQAGGYPPVPPQGYYDPRHGPHRKKKSFWSELFDD